MSNFDFYRPQTKFAKVTFLHLSVSHSVHRGVCFSVCWDTHPSRTRHPPGTSHPPGSRNPPGADPPGSRPPSRSRQPPQTKHPWSRHPPQQAPPEAGTPPFPTVHAGRYGQQAGGMHPTGMQSCFTCF